MAHFNPTVDLATHEVFNQVPAFEDRNVYDLDQPLQEAVAREGAGWAQERFRAFGERVGSAEVIEWGMLANRNTPQLRSFDRYGHRIDEVEFHPAYHALMDLGLSHGVSSIAWTARADKGEKGYAAHAVLLYLMSQAEPGVCCPMTMTFASVPALRQEDRLAAVWEPLIRGSAYDAASRPVTEKSGATVGMAMTEKQGGSDVRANTTMAVPEGAGGPGAAYRLTGHKWFCSAPMCDGFLTLAQAAGGLSCFFVPRWRPDGSRNAMHIMRLKDKLGDRANASSEIEYHNAHAVLVGEEGRGVRVIMDMVQHTRLDTILAPASFMRQALVQAVWHARHRTAFQRKLIDQPLMRRVLADLAVEAEAATALFMRIARSFDNAAQDPREAAFMRIATPAAKYWVNKRCPGFIYEAMECHGGAGYVEESVLPRLYRQAPLNSIWEGSGNVICLDVMRALSRTPDALTMVLSDLDNALGQNRHYDTALTDLLFLASGPGPDEGSARLFTECLAKCLQASLLIRHAPAPVADLYCARHLSGQGGSSFGAHGTVDDATIEAVLNRVLPAE